MCTQSWPTRWACGQGLGRPVQHCRQIVHRSASLHVATFSQPHRLAPACHPPAGGRHARGHRAAALPARPTHPAAGRQPGARSPPLHPHRPRRHVALLLAPGRPPRQHPVPRAECRPGGATRLSRVAAGHGRLGRWVPPLTSKPCTVLTAAAATVCGASPPVAAAPSLGPQPQVSPPAATSATAPPGAWCRQDAGGGCHSC